MTDDGPEDSKDSEEDVLDHLEEIREQLRDEPELNSTDPREAFGIWLTDNQDKADSTLQSYEYRVKPFLDFLEDEGIDDLADVTTRTVTEFQVARKAEGDLEKQSQNNQFGTLKQFLAFAADMNAVREDAVEAVTVPSLTKSERVNTAKLVTERAEEILENLDNYRHASRDHVLALLMWRTTLRAGALQSLDLEDLYLSEDDMERIRDELAQEYPMYVVDQILEDVEVPFIWPRNRPAEGTRLKNGEGGERAINLTPWVGDVVQDYIRVNRPDIDDEHGREPLFASRKGTGRLAETTMRNWTYILTQPCEFGGECPHNRDPEECEARQHGYGSKCPSSRSPHKLRTGSITWHRDRGWPIAELADKANTSKELIEGVYDQPEKLVRAAHRRSLLDKLDGDTETDQR